jgi:hypothetical protein
MTAVESAVSPWDAWGKILVPFRKCVGAVQPRESTSVSRRGMCDREIWRKPLAFAADAGELWVLLGKWLVHRNEGA